MSRKRKENGNSALMNLLHATLRARGLTLADIARTLGISYIYMSSLSNGARQVSGLKLEKQRQLARFLGISMIDLFLMTGVLRQEDLVSR